MSSIQKANALPTWWIGKSPKYGIQKRVKMRPGLTDEECQTCMNNILEKLDKEQDKRRVKQQEHEAYIQSDEYPRSKIQNYKHQEIQMLETNLQNMRNQNNSIFVGGYTEPARMSHKAELDRIEAYGVKRRAEIEERYKETPKNLERIRQQAIHDDERNKECLQSAHLVNTAGCGSSLIPRVGGVVARHAVEHGGGFNHRGIYAGGVWR
jgi:hypothetical protein